MHFAECFLPEDEMILTSRKLGANKILSSEVFNKKYQKIRQGVQLLLSFIIKFLLEKNLMHPFNVKQFKLLKKNMKTVRYIMAN